MWKRGSRSYSRRLDLNLHCRPAELVESKRPVKVSLSSSSTVHQVLSQARKLRHSASFSSVYVRPDRSEEERSKDRLLVTELLKKREAEPDQLHFIRAGKIHSRDKAKT